MREYEENGWIVTTPVYVGTKERLPKMTACAHKWVDGELNIHEVIEDGIKQRTEIVIQRCKCGAIRSRRRPI